MTTTEAMRLALDALDALHKFADSRECRHESTHRGGAIWTICDDCGRKWADDRDPFKPWVEPAEFSAADAAIAALRAALADDGWRPIETAPKDGTDILVAGCSFIHCVGWNEEYEWWAVDDNKIGPFRLRGKAPTHWMPLPAAPKD